MAERRFTRLKASLSENAAKTRENVSRELRQSLISDSESLSDHFDDNYEQLARQLEQQSGVPFPPDDVHIVDHNVTADCPSVESMGGGFAKECVRQFSGRKRRIVFQNEKFFGSVFECFETKSELKPQIFCCDSTADESRVVRETNCLMNRMTGYLVLTSLHDTCVLSFFRDRKRSQMVWTQEVTQEVAKSAENCFRIDCHSIEMNSSDIEDWIQDINESRFDVNRHVTHLRSDLSRSLDDFFGRHSVNLFSTFADLTQRRGVFAVLRERAPPKKEDHIFSFVAVFERFEVNDRNKDFFALKVSLFDSTFGRISEDMRIEFNRKISFCVDFRESKANDLFLVTRVEKSVHPFPNAHFEPFLWSARPLFKSDSRDLDSSSNFTLFYRSSSLSDDHVTAALSQSKGTTIAAKLVVRLESDSASALPVVCLRPLCDPIARFHNWLFVCLQSLRFENQKLFSKARNLCIQVSLRDDDQTLSPSLPLIEGPNGLQSEAFSAVTRHHVTPDFYEEVKIQMPLKLTDKLHVLFRLFHVSCKKECLKTGVGFAWLPLNNKSTVGSHALSVFASLPDGYLQCQSLGLGRGLSMPDMKLVGKDLLRVCCRLSSSVMSSDASIETSMECVTAINAKDTDISKAVSCERSLQKNLRALTVADKKELIRFSHVILQQLLRLVSRPTGDQTLRSVLALLQCLRPEVIWDFVDISFESEVGFHVTLLSALNRLLRDCESEDESRVLLRHLGFFLRVHIKAIVEHLFRSDAILKPREERFEALFASLVRQLVANLSSLIVSHSRLEEVSSANRAFSHYLTRLLSLCDRSLGFQCLQTHLQNTFSRDIVISELRLSTLATVTAHEHHVALNHPLPEAEMSLSEDFRRKHFSAFLLLQEFKHSLHQSVRHTRQQSLHVLRNLLAKHSFDTRYDITSVVTLYLPTLDIVLDNVNRIIDPKPRLEERSPKPETHHTRHNSLPVRFDAFNCDEIKDIVICFAFVSKHLSQESVLCLSAEKADQCLHVLQTALQVFEFSENSELRAKTLPNDICVNQTLHDFLCSQNLSQQISLITLRTARILLKSHATEERVLQRVMSTLVTLLLIPQSLQLLIHSFENIRFFAQNFSNHVFSSPLFQQLVARVVHFLDSQQKSARDACVDLLFCLFGINFRRTRFETIVCVSRLASKDSAKDLSRFQTALTRLDSLAADSDPRLKQTVQRVRDILTATHRIRSEARNEYESCELRLFLANSYAQTSLRRTWLENLAESHKTNSDWTEHAMCLAHVIAIVIHELRSKGVAELESAPNHLTHLSSNLQTEQDLGGDQDGDWLEPDDTSLDTLRLLVDDCVSALVRAELFELAVHALKVLVEVHERHHEHKQLATLYTRLAQMHSRAQELNDSGKRLFDTYFRVAFCSNGQPTDEFIYRESKVVSLAEMTQKLRRLHPSLTIGDSSDAAIVVTHVSPQPLSANNVFERHVGINRFQYEQRLSSADSSVAQQRKKRVVLITQHFLPFCVKRVPVVDRHETILSPIEVAIDEMTDRVQQLEKVTQSDDVKHLQLVLQGSVQVSVNQGPLAYAEAFLSSNDSKSEELKQLFARFLDLCEIGLKINERLIKSDQLEYHLALRHSFERLRARLDVHEPKRTSVQIFDVISGSSLA